MVAVAWEVTSLESVTTRDPLEDVRPYWEWADPDGAEAFVEPGGLVDIALHELGAEVQAVDVLQPDEC